MDVRWSKPKTGSGRRKLDRARAEEIGFAALLFVTGDPDRLTRFLAATGMDAADLKTSAGEPATLAALLSHVAEDDSTLLVFTASADCSPEEVIQAQSALGFDTGYDRST
jgi:hypothetical protein